jgi:hypothetical protein
MPSTPITTLPNQRMQSAALIFCGTIRATGRRG